MDTKALSIVLRRAAALFAASGAKIQAQAAGEVAETLEKTADSTIDDFVSNSLSAVDVPRLDSLTPAEIAAKINSARGNTIATNSIVRGLLERAVDKDTVIQLAELMTGARLTGSKTKPNALKAIQKKIAERAYLDSKDAMNQKVTPW